MRKNRLAALAAAAAMGILLAACGGMRAENMGTTGNETGVTDAGIGSGSSAAAEDSDDDSGGADGPDEMTAPDGTGGADHEDGADSADGTLIVRIPEDIGNLDPYEGSSPEYAMDWVYEGLTACVDGEVVPELAESWEVSADGLEYVLHLRDGVKLSDGSDFDSETAGRCVEEVLARREYYPYLPSLSAIDTVEATDSRTLTVRLKTPANSMLYDLAASYPLVMAGRADSEESQSLAAGNDPVDAEEHSALAGTGRWILREYVEDEYALFERNENYWGEKPETRYMKAVVIPAAEEAAAALESGEIDMLMDSTRGITPELARRMEASGYTIETDDTTSISMLTLNTAGAVTGDRSVRLAMEYAADSQTVSEEVFGGLESPARSFFSPKIPYTDIGLEPYSYDPDRANQILEEAGWGFEEGENVRSKNGQRLEVDMIYDEAVESGGKTGRLLQKAYAEVGIQLNLVPLDSQTMRERWEAGEFGAVLDRSWGAPYDPFGTFACMASPGERFYIAQKGLSGKAELDVILRDSLSQADEGKLREDFDYIMETLHGEAVYIPLTVPGVVTVHE